MSVLDLKSGKIIGDASVRAGVDIIAYNQKLAHLYLPGGDSRTITIVGVSSSGAPAMLKTADMVDGVHCVTADDRDQVYVYDPCMAKSLYSKTRCLPANKRLVSVFFFGRFIRIDTAGMSGL